MARRGAGPVSALWLGWPAGCDGERGRKKQRLDFLCVFVVLVNQLRVSCPPPVNSGQNAPRIRRGLAAVSVRPLPIRAVVH